MGCATRTAGGWRGNAFPLGVPLGVPLAVLAVAALCGARCSSPFSPRARQSVSIVSYNAHNLFDDVDSGTEYPEFDMDKGKWSSDLYRKRMDRVAEAVASLESAFPDILCLQEIESGKVLRDLAAGALKKAGYRQVVEGGPGESAIRSGILTRLPVLETRMHAVADSWGFGPARDMVEVVLDRGEGKRLIVFVCHWKSRREGEEATEAARRAQAGLAASRVSAALAADPGAEIIVCGDFNESPDEYARTGGRYPTALMPASAGAMAVPGGALLVTDRMQEAGFHAPGSDGGVAGAPVLYSPWASSPGYSYRYKGGSERLDGFLLSRSLCDGASLDLESFSVADDAFLMDSRGDPLAWNGSTGYSDHLPIRLKLAVLSAPAVTGTLR